MFKVCFYFTKTIKDFEILKLVAFLSFGIGLNKYREIIYEYKEIAIFPKANGLNWPYKIYIHKFKGNYSSLLRVISNVNLGCLGFLIVIVDMALKINKEVDVKLLKIFFKS